MRRWLIAALLLSGPTVALAEQNSKSVLPACTVAQLAAGTCAPAKHGTRVLITNSDAFNDSDCTSGTGIIGAICEYDATTPGWFSPPTSVQGSVNSYYLSGPTMNLILCGENDENGTIYFGPNTAHFGGDGSDSSLTSAACDALDNATEATADAPVSANTVLRVVGLYCTTDATLGASESIVFNVRSAAANVVPAVNCTIGTGQTTCSSGWGESSISVAAGATLAVQAVETSNNADGDESWCVVTLALQS